MVAIEYVINEYLYIAIGYWDISFFCSTWKTYICRVHKVNVHLVQMILN